MSKLVFYAQSTSAVLSGRGGGGGRGVVQEMMMKPCCFTSTETVGLLGTGATAPELLITAPNNSS